MKALAASVGQAIAAYRRRQRQLHNGRPWAQEDLAVAIGSDKGHINRIEKGRQVPNRDTLVRICRSLQLDWTDEEELLITAGHAPDLRFPAEDELAAIIGRVSRVIDQVDHPAILLDVIDRNWYWNPSARAFYSGAVGMTPDELTAVWRGKPILELYFDPLTSARFRRLFCPSHIVRALVRLRRRAGMWQRTPEYRALIERLSGYPRFVEMWHESNELEENLVYTDQAVTTIRHTRFGSVQVEMWWTRLLKDDRFLVHHHLPVDAVGRRAFAVAANGSGFRVGATSILSSPANRYCSVVDGGPL